jgi:hypothetical protein
MRRRRRHGATLALPRLRSRGRSRRRRCSWCLASTSTLGQRRTQRPPALRQEQDAPRQAARSCNSPPPRLGVCAMVSIEAGQDASPLLSALFGTIAAGTEMLAAA